MRRGEEALTLAANLTLPECFLINWRLSQIHNPPGTVVSILYTCVCSCSKKAFPNIDDKTELWMTGGSCKNLYVVNQNINRATSQICLKYVLICMWLIKI